MNEQLLERVLKSPRLPSLPTIALEVIELVQQKNVDIKQIADTINRVLAPQGVAILVEAKHQCMTTRGIKKPDVATITTQFTGVFKDDPRMEQRFMTMIRGY